MATKGDGRTLLEVSRRRLASIHGKYLVNAISVDHGACYASSQGFSVLYANVSSNCYVA
jgi:hypothetical protein